MSLLSRPTGWFFSAFIITLLIQCVPIIHVGNAPPTIGDAIENQNIAWNLAHGFGYRYDWDQPAWRAPYESAAKNSPRIVTALRRTGGHVTASRPPLVPLLGAIAIWFSPMKYFLAWRCAEALIVALSIALLVTVTQKIFGNMSAGILLILTAFDPSRLHLSPTEWMTEGVSYAGIAVLVSILLLILNGHTSRWLLLSLGLCMGWLLLSRNTFFVLMPVVPLIILKAGFHRRRQAIAHATAVCILAMLCCLPWWIHNIHVLHSFMPLGTQGQVNLPAEYSDIAVDQNGQWCADAIGAAADLPLHRAAALGLCPPLPSASQLRSLAWPGAQDQYLSGLFAYAVTAGPSIDTEKQLAAIGSQTSRQWIKDNWRKIPPLTLAKLWTEVRPKWWLILIYLTGGIIAFIRPQYRTAVLMLFLICATAAITIMLTHSVDGRFIVPYMPALQLLFAGAFYSAFPSQLAKQLEI